MAELPSDKVRSEYILAFTGTSLATSTLLFFFTSSVPAFSFYFGPPVSLMTIIFHVTVLLLIRRHRNSPNSSPYPSMRPAIGLASFLLLAWLTTAIFMVYGLIVLPMPEWWNTPEKVLVIAPACLGLMETVFMLLIVLLGRRALKSRETAEREGRIQI